MSRRKLEVAGEVVVEVTRQLADPSRALRDRLGLVVDQLERHVATSTGPTPYSWRALQVLRQDLAGAYLEATTLARRISELGRVIDDELADWFELPTTVDLGLRLANHHLVAGIELLIDLGRTPLVRGEPGVLALLVAQLVAACSSSARAVAGSSLSVRVTHDGAWAVLLIADNGGGSPRAPALGELVRELIEPWGGLFAAASEPGKGCAFELRLITHVG